MHRFAIRQAVICAFVLLCCGSSPGRAADLFRTEVVSGGESTVQETNNILDVPDLFDTQTLEATIVGFEADDDSFAARLDLRGLPSILIWDAITTTLTFSLLGEKVSFIAANLDEAVDDFEAWLRGDLEVEGATLTITDLLHGLVEFSPVDPVAGNPNSLQSRMFQTDYALGTEGPFTSGAGRLDSAPNHWNVGFDYGYAMGDVFDVQALDLPFAYRWNLRHPKWSMLFSLPLSVTFTENQWSVLASGGLGVQYRPTVWWSLTPMFRVGGAGSLDVGALAVLYSLTVTSSLRFEWRGIEFAMGNLGGFTKTTDGIEIGDFNFNYDLTNPILTNGGTIAGDTTFVLLGRPLAWRFFVWNTQIFGDAVYMDSQSEVGLGLSAPGTKGGNTFDAVSLSLGYVFGNEDYDGLSLRLRLRF